MSLKTKALLAIFVAALLWSGSAAVPKLLFLKAPPFTVAFERFAIASLLILPFVVRVKKPKNYVMSLLPLGIFNAVNIICYYGGLSLTTANTASILGPTVPLVVAVLSYILIGESVSKKKFFGIAIGLTGALLIVLAPLWYHSAFTVGNLWGNLLLVGSNVSWSLYIMYSRKILSEGTFPPILSTAMNFFAVTVTTGVAALLFRQPLLTPAITQPAFLALLLYAAIGITMITFFLFQWGVQYVTAATASMKEYIQLIVGIGINTVVLGDHFTVTYVMGSLLILIGLTIATSEHMTKKLASVLFTQGE